MHRELRLVILRIQNLKENVSWESTVFHHMEEDSEGNQNRAVLCLNIKPWILKFKYIFWKVIFTTLDIKVWEW